MKAYAITEAGAAPTVVDLPIPEPEAGEIRVRVNVASVNGFDVAVAAGFMMGFFEHRFPVVLGRDFAGAVDAIGPDVDGFEIGDRVFGVVSKPHLHDGSFAEYTTVPVASAVAKTPDSVSDSVAAALGHTGTTALVCLGNLDLEGSTILVVGATGGVGTLATQLAVAAGARVIATGRTEEGRARLRAFGAEAVDYTRGLADVVREVAPDGVDAALHLAGDPVEISPLVREGGAFISPLLYSPEMFGDERLHFVPVAAYPDPATLERLAALVEAGDLTVVVHHQYRFDEVGAAAGAWGHETIGKLLVTT